MALDAIHIRARDLSPESYSGDGAVSHHQVSSRSGASRTAQRRSSSPPSTYLRKSGLGSREAENANTEWHSLRTGESLAAKALRMRHRFVKATHLSDPTLAAQLKEESHGEPTELTSTTATEGATCSGTPETFPLTLAQLYSQLAQDMPMQQSESPEPSHVDTSLIKSHDRILDQQSHRSHRHHHQFEARNRTEWFISRACKKLRQSQQDPRASSKLAPDIRSSKDEAVEESIASSSLGRRCPRCGDILPPNATLDYMARHRQSIGHRLGLNAPVSSASASEAPSPAPSVPVTPASRSRSTSPGLTAVPDAAMQDHPKQLSRMPRRLSNAPRWKKIAGDNLGHSLLSRMGWKEGMGLGVQEWKWQQLRREKEKRLRTSAVRSLLLQRHNLDQQMEPVVNEARFPYGVEPQDAEQERNDAERWFSDQVRSEVEWVQDLTLDERRTLEQALMSRQMTMQEVQDAISVDDDGFPPCLFSSQQREPTLAAAEVATNEENGDVTQTNALLYPVEVELRSDRRGIGVKRPSVDADTSIGPARRPRAAEGSVQIRRPSSPSFDQLGAGRKKLKLSSAGRSSQVRSRSRPNVGSSRRTETQGESTRRQREQVYQQDERDWLDLRASLS